jgi:predicted TIM-barrel fold metal-dependent hydrolase
MFEKYTSEIFPPEPLLPPNDRHGQKGDLTLQAGTIVFSADDHIELAEDIWCQNFPARLKDKAPRIWQTEKGATHISVGGKSLLPDAFAAVFEPYGRVAGFNSSNMDARMRDLDDEGIAKELAFPNAIMALLNYPDYEVRELCFRIYNQYIASLQERCPGRFYGVGLINWWDPAGARRTLMELKALGLRTFLLPLSPGMHPNGGNRIDYASTQMTPVWEEIAGSGIPVSHHIGEVTTHPCEFNSMKINFVHNVAPFRDMFARYIFGGILDRHPTLQIGWFEGGVNWVVSAMQDAEHAHASFWHMDNLKIKHEPDYYWRKHMCASFMVDPLGLEMIDHLGVDKVLWSSDYPHMESSFGYSKSSINHVVKILGPERAVGVVGGNVARFLKM